MGIKKIFMRGGRLRPCVVPLAALVVLGAFAAAGVTQLIATFRYDRKDISQDPVDLGIAKMDVPEGITSIALFGIDARNDNFRGLSDSIMIITADAEHNSIKLVSVMRDSLVKVDGYGYQKINAAYNLGGAQLAVKTLNQTFDLDIRNYATVDFVSMAGIIDVVGGIEAELTKAEVKNANVQIKTMNQERKTPLDYIEKEGLQTLSGIQAVAFSRVRYVATVNGTQDDFGRTERQRLVMYQLFQKALAMDISKYPAMIKAIMPYMETSLSYNDIFKLAGILTSSGLSFRQERIPVDGAVINEGLNVKGLGSCVYYNLDYAAKLLNAFIYEDVSFEDYMAQNGVDRSGWYAGATGETSGKQPVSEAEEEEEIETGGVSGGSETQAPSAGTGEEDPPEESGNTSSGEKPGDESTGGQTGEEDPPDEGTTEDPPDTNDPEGGEGDSGEESGGGSGSILPPPVISIL